MNAWEHLTEAEWIGENCKGVERRPLRTQHKIMGSSVDI